MAERLDERGEPLSATHDSERTTFSASEARQAGMGARIFLVLAASLALAFVVWGIVEWSQDREDRQPAAGGSVQPTVTEPRPN